MRIVRKILIIISKTVACALAVVVLVIAGTSFSPVYRFRAAEPFSGPDIFNPYKDLDTSIGWKRANFHTHTKVNGLMNECEYWPEEVDAKLRKLDYDIVTFSNHNELTPHPYDTAMQVNVYEHGYNLLKFHKLVFGSEEVMHYDHMLPIFAFQKQFQIEYLKKTSEIIQINHPLRTPSLSESQLEKLCGYRLIELDSGKSTENEYWDKALSAGRYSFGVANDDLHYPDRSNRIGVRCNFLCCRSASWKDIKKCFDEGCFYSMRVPDYGNGDWSIKYEKNSHLPHVTGIGMKDNTIYIHLSCQADSIKVTGQNHTTLMKVADACSLEYMMSSEDSYARMTAYFPEGEVIYSNPFARYDASSSESPFNDEPLDYDLLLSILYNLAIVTICLVDIYVIYLILKRRK